VTKKKIKIAVTGAAGQIGYSLLFRIAAGEMFGPETQVDLHLLELAKALPALQGVVMELQDCAFPLLDKVIQTADPCAAFDQVDWALLIGSVPRKAGMERKDLLKINADVFRDQGRALNDAAKKETKVLVVGNPCNTNALIAKEQAKNIPDNNFFAMTMLDQNRAVAQIAQKANCSVEEVKDLVVWGNHSSTQFPDFYHATIWGKPLLQVIEDEKWLQTSFMEKVQKRGSAIIKARGLSSAASAAQAILATVKNLSEDTKNDGMFSVGVCSDGSYGVKEGLVFSYPVRIKQGAWEIVQNIKHAQFAQEKITLTQEELIEERNFLFKPFP